MTAPPGANDVVADNVPAVKELTVVADGADVGAPARSVVGVVKVVTGVTDVVVTATVVVDVEPMEYFCT